MGFFSILLFGIVLSNAGVVIAAVMDKHQLAAKAEAILYESVDREKALSVPW